MLGPYVTFSMDGYCVWDPSLITDAQGRHHLFFSRWPIEHGFEAWVTHSEVCRASAETLLGPYHFEEVVLPRRAGFWDGDVTHNPLIQRFGNQYYLYYTGNDGDGSWWSHRNHQRIGVAVADRPQGPWKRFDQPLLDVTPGAWDAKVTTNPCCLRGPDGRFILIYKGVGEQLPGPKFGPVLHGVAFADSPIGPFIKHPTPIFAATGSQFPGEDPFVWCSHGRYFALLKDMDRFYSPATRAIVKFESDDAINWELSDHPIFTERTWVDASGHPRQMHRLERPFLHLDGEEPHIFCCAVKPHADSEESFIAAMPCT